MVDRTRRECGECADIGELMSADRYFPKLSHSSYIFFRQGVSVTKFVEREEGGGNRRTLNRL